LSFFSLGSGVAPTVKQHHRQDKHPERDLAHRAIAMPPDNTRAIAALAASIVFFISVSSR
jgi:hypothetical protein